MVNPIELLKETWSEYSLAKGARLGAALSYYTFTSFFPLLLVLISLIGLALSLGLPTARDASSYVLDTVSTTLPAARDLIEQSLEETERKPGTLGIVGLLTGLWAASNIFQQLDEAFNVIFHVTPLKRSFLDNLKARGRAAGLVVLVALLMVTSLIFSTVIKTLEDIALLLPGGPTLAWGMHLGISLLLSALVFAALYRYLPDKPVSWKAALVGGLFSSVAWLIGRELLTWWLGRAGGVTAGTVVGSVLAFLVLIYYAAQILLFGAEMVATYDKLAHPETARDTGPETPTIQPLGSPTTGGEMPVGLMGKMGPVTLPSRAVPFGVGFVTGVLSLFIGARALLDRVLQRGTRA